MCRVQRLDRLNGQEPANLLDSKSLTLKFRMTQIGRFFWVNGDPLAPCLNDGRKAQDDC